MSVKNLGLGQRSCNVYDLQSEAMAVQFSTEYPWEALTVLGGAITAWRTQHIAGEQTRGPCSIPAMFISSCSLGRSRDVGPWQCLRWSHPFERTEIASRGDLNFALTEHV